MRPLMSTAADAAMSSGKTDDEEHTPSSDDDGSTPEPTAATAENTSAPQDPAQPQKRKGGRKPIYATSEERKQRNRQAQAAFRERRTEYIKQLEATIKQHEEALRSLQQSHRSAADECLMLRYKNSLLERILLEKGIDVQAELSVKTGSPLFDANNSPSQMSAPMVPAPLQRAAVNRQHARRSYQGTTANGRTSSLATQYTSRPSPFGTQSPTGQPTPASHVSSPTAMSNRSSVSTQQTGLPSPASVVISQAPSQASASAHSHASGTMPPASHAGTAPYHLSSTMSTISNASSKSGTTAVQAGVPSNSVFDYPPQFQKQMDQLDRDYDSNLRTNVDHESDISMGQDYEAANFGIPNHYAPFDNQHMPQQQHLVGAVGSQTVPRGRARDLQAAMFAGGQPPFDSFDSMLDADPFGLSASMHFPTTYSFDQAPQK